MKSGGFPAAVKSSIPQFFKLLFPPACPLCLTTLPIGDSAPFCSTCLGNFTPLPPAHCPVCALPFSGSENSSHLCGRCIKNPPVFVKVFASGVYEKSLRHAIHQFKFNQRLGLDRALGTLLDDTIDSDLTFDVVVPVPLSRLKLRQRGYNQSYLLACEFARIRGLQVDNQLLSKIRETKEQHGLSAHERETNLKTAFRLEGSLNGETVLLIDDVLTTGKTAELCSQILKQGGAGDIYVAVIGRAP